MLSLREEVKALREEVAELRKRNSPRSETVPLDKFAYSAGILIGGLFLFTWFLILMVYRKVNQSNVENASLMSDVLRLIKILNLLSRGNVVKMENGKLMVYDRKSERWKEVD